MWALLTVYQALRRAIVTAVESRPGTDPDRASFTTALEAAKNLLVNAVNITADPTDLVGRIGHAVLTNLLPPRRPRTACARSNPRCRATTRKTHTDPNQHADHQPDRHHQRRRTETCDTRTEIVDNSPRTLTTRH